MKEFEDDNLNFNENGKKFWQRFQKTVLHTCKNQGLFGRGLNVHKNLRFLCLIGQRKPCGKRRKCWLPAVFSFSHKVFKMLLPLCCRNQRLLWRGSNEQLNHDVSIDYIVFNSIFYSILFILLLPVHPSMLSQSSFNQYLAQYSFQATGCFPT